MGPEEKGENTTRNTKRKLPEALEKNLWQPGQSGNPGGRPKRKPISDLYEEILNDPAELEKIRAAVVKALTRGNMAMVLQLKEMSDRVEGKVTQPIEADVNVNLADAIAEARKRAAE